MMPEDPAPMMQTNCALMIANLLVDGATGLGGVGSRAAAAFSHGPLSERRRT